MVDHGAGQKFHCVWVLAFVLVLCFAASDTVVAYSPSSCTADFHIGIYNFHNMGCALCCNAAFFLNIENIASYCENTSQPIDFIGIRITLL
jgi:hypothetical protein